MVPAKAFRCIDHRVFTERHAVCVLRIVQKCIHILHVKSRRVVVDIDGNASAILYHAFAGVVVIKIVRYAGLRIGDIDGGSAFGIERVYRDIRSACHSLVKEIRIGSKGIACRCGRFEGKLCADIYIRIEHTRVLQADGIARLTARNKRIGNRRVVMCAVNHHNAGVYRGDRAVAADDELTDSQRDIGLALYLAEVDHNAQQFILKASERDQLCAAFAVIADTIARNKRNIAVVLER